MNSFVALTVVVTLGLLALSGRRYLDRRADANAWARLLEIAGPADRVFEADMIEALPEPAQRYFRYVIRPGTPLHRAVEIEMTGELGFGTKSAPEYRAMRAHQILAPPHGLVWRLKAGPISGADGATPESSWTRFWLLGLVPIVRAGGNADHRRSAFGRVVAEAAFWAPASLLPGSHVSWTSLDANSARATVSCGAFRQSVDIAVAEDGRPTRVVIRRWSDANPEKEYREQPFGGYLSEFRDFDGYRLPTHVEGGNHIGTDDYFAFFKADVVAVRFPARGKAS